MAEGWERRGEWIVKTFEFRDFSESVAFLVRIAMLAEKLNHHPDISLSWNKVEVKLTTHSEGRITERDLEMAEKIDKLLED